MDRRQFIKTTAAGAASAALASCGVKGGKPQSEGTMEMRTNPINGDKVSLLGYGCMRWQMIKDEEGHDIIDQDSVDELVDMALASGVNYFDTSPAYLQGQSEKASAAALNRHPRNSYFLATKLSNFRNWSREASMKMYYDSFDVMETDYIDYYLLHNIGRGGFEAFSRRYIENGMMDFLLAQREKGKIRQLGFSFHGSQPEFDAMLATHDTYKYDFVQIQLNYVDWKHADGVRNVNADYLYDKITALGLPIVVMEPLQGGALANLPRSIAQQLKERDPDASAASWAMRFVGTHPGVLTVLSGMTYQEHLEDNLSTFTGFKPLSEAELDFLERLATTMKEYPTVNCTACNYCMPCPWGVDIPGTFQHYNRAVGEGDFPQNPQQKDFARLRRRYLLSYDRAVESLRQASHCIGCKECLTHCPQSINIPAELHRIDRYIEKIRREG